MGCASATTFKTRRVRVVALPDINDLAGKLYDQYDISSPFNCTTVKLAELLYASSNSTSFSILIYLNTCILQTVIN